MSRILAIEMSPANGQANTLVGVDNGTRLNRMEPTGIAYIQTKTIVVCHIKLSDGSYDAKSLSIDGILPLIDPRPPRDQH